MNSRKASIDLNVSLVIPSTTDDYFLYSSSSGNNEKSALKRYLKNAEKKDKKFRNGKNSKDTIYNGAAAKIKSPKIYRKQMHIYMPSPAKDTIDAEVSLKTK